MSGFQEFNRKKVLITGGLGFIGSNLSRRLVDLGATITIVDSLIPEYGGNLNIEINGDFRNLEINSKAQISILESCKNYNPNIKIVFASTRQIYGKPDYLPVDENHLLRPVDINGVNKMAGEWFHIIYNNVHGVRTCALRLTNTYGPCMRIKDSRQTF